MVHALNIWLSDAQSATILHYAGIKSPVPLLAIKHAEMHGMII